MEKLKLPKPQLKGDIAIEKVLKGRRSVRVYRNEPVTVEQLGQLLWAAQGITHERIYRTAPSAGGTYPLELFVIAGNVEDLEPGVYRYRCRRHELTPVSPEDVRGDLAMACHEQMWMEKAPLMVVFTAVFKRTMAAYGERAKRYVDIEVGHAAQNLMLQSVVYEMGTCPMGAFDDARVRELLGATEEEEPRLILTVGR